MAESPNGGREGGRAEGGMVVEKAHWSKYIPVGLLVVVDMYRRCIFYSTVCTIYAVVRECVEPSICRMKPMLNYIQCEPILYSMNNTGNSYNLSGILHM